MLPEIKTIDLGMSNCYLIRQDGQFFLIDSGPVTKRLALEERLNNAGCQPGNLKMVVLTHGDSDHTGNAAFLREKYGAKIALHPLDVTAVESGDMFRTRSHMNIFTKTLGKLILIILGVNNPDRFKPDMLIEDGFDLSSYGLDARVEHTPGHSAGSISILTANGDCFCGDLVSYDKGKLNSLVDDGEANHSSLEKIKGLDVHTLYPGHGQAFPKTTLTQPESQKEGSRAAKIAVSAIGVLAGILGIEHGLFETLQGNTAPGSLMISAFGPPCQMTKVWHGCEPAMTLIPSFLVTGILAMLVSVFVIICAGGYLHRKNGRAIFVLLSILMLLVGGGFIPPLFGFITAFAASRIKPLPAVKPSRGVVDRLLAGAWPWTLVLFLAWDAAEWIIGYYYNDAMMAFSLPSFLLMIALLLLVIFSGFAFDIQKQPEPGGGD